MRSFRGGCWCGLLSVVLAWGCAAGTASAASAPEATPVTQSVPNPFIRNRADPHVFREPNGHYVFTATVPEYDRIILRQADSIGGLASAPEKVIWRHHDRGEMANHVWAPEIHRIDGRWVVYFTAGSSDDPWKVRLYALENASDDPMHGQWVEKGRIFTDFDSFSLDATTFELHGQRYLVWTQRPLQPKDAGTSIYIAKMSDAYHIVGPQVGLSAPVLPWERMVYNVNEAPAALVHGDHVFITYSASATDDNYCMGLLSTRVDADLLDPRAWTKSQQPVFKTSERNHQYGPGHNAFVLAEDGQTTLMFYHARDSKQLDGGPLHDPNRHTRVIRLGWTADGMPIFGEPPADGTVSLLAPPAP